jgi:formate hydrogenlyase transcriptional activator
VAEKKFREDLYYRLNVFPIKVPPLRERPEDVPLLVSFFVNKFAKQMKKPIEGLPAKVMSALTSYPWPGNIRELQNVIERAMILSRGTHLEIPLSELQKFSEAARTHPEAASLQAIEREHILSVLRESNWIIGGATGAAARLDLPRTTLHSKMRQLGIARPRP